MAQAIQEGDEYRAYYTSIALVDVIELTRGRQARVSPEDAKWLAQWSWCACFPSGKAVYAARSTSGGGRVYMHRAISERMGLSGEIDHIDCDGLNNQRTNLRAVTSAQNKYNTRLSARNTTGFKGVTFNKVRRIYQSYINAPDGRHAYLGGFESPRDAAAAYDAAALAYFGEHARTNKMMGLL